MISALFGALFVNPDDVRVAHVAEELGFDSIWVAGHMLWPNPTAEVISSLGYLAAKTSRVKLGSAILLLPLYNALSVAKSVAMLQELSDGRVLLGIGIGGEFAPEFRAAGVDRARRGRISNDQLSLMRHLWRNPGRPIHAGLHEVTADAPPLYPRTQSPAPILIGGRTTSAMRRAARLGDGILPYFVTPERYAELKTEVCSLRADTGRDHEPFHFATAVFVSVARTTEEGRANAVDYFRWQYDMDGEPLVDRYAIYGTPEHCAERYRQYIDAGVQHFVNIPVGPEPVKEQLARIMEVADGFP